MPIRYTTPIANLMTPPLDQRIQQCVAEFPELGDRKITVGLTRSADGTAEAESMTIRLNVRPRKPVSCFTIGHELTHLLQRGGLAIVPDGEQQCDVWTLARSALFLDDRPSYLCAHLWSRDNWPLHAGPVRQLCLEAIEVRKTNRRYLAWLRQQLEAAVLTYARDAVRRRREA
jgi:hypothetical protein